jgi:hypothetical protein
MKPAYYSPWRAALLGLVGTASMGGLIALGACSDPPNTGRVTVVLEPDYQAYHDNVDAYLAQRCGTLDCHGQAGRAYRIYSRQGFRLTANDSGLVSGQQPTSDAERMANFEAIAGLEPEELSRVMAAQGADDALLRWIWIRKPLKLERHKGGTVMATGDPGYDCVVGWLRIPVTDGQGNPIPAGARAPMSPAAVAACQMALTFP